MQGIRSAVAYQGLATLDSDILQQQVQFVTGQTVPTNDAWISSVEQQIGARQTTFWGAVQTLTQSDAAKTQIQNVYADWGQLPPSDAELQTAGAALYNLSRGWQVVQGQNSTDWASETGAYQALPANASFGDYITNLASSSDQARNIVASMLYQPLMENAWTTQDARNVLIQGGAQMLSATVDQGVVNSVVMDDQNNPQQPCKDIDQFKRDVPKTVTNKGQITAANAQWQIVNQRDWPDAYKTDGIVWNASGGGVGPTLQGTPYEAYVQQKLNGGSPDGSYVWLQDHKSNWKVFDHWNEKSGNAVSDKTINTGLDTLRDKPVNIKYRIWADLKKMAMTYDNDASREGTNQVVRFQQADIKSYTFELGVRDDKDADDKPVTTDAQWEQICLAYHGAAAKMVSYGAANKPLTFEIDAIT
ncbi:hypothetical protein AA23498_0126 [Acetobacter nitrogenifigens DSM 23921 = NBRC 105050]|uniref:CdiA toxin EC869-like domain-containing protein n=1 Tax=Acetobacter nitrogenifigens DSM 23921 = NBRC 105050 TaxID=1120919 RepID=A0A511X8U6_9PROT|nr:hypothetical protein [Acetobacter nitrogenifigens]GBQ87398.1 hypothetical protein AA23498_0126 [Acetobacter nitrogenifigens DSM 23921 = NBRC 105050]GEN59359.1 hypothetical protein ANI02nite_12430 [Acetobacter nitrogenifigens DSM 23921 = NBRC 105050]